MNRYEQLVAEQEARQLRHETDRARREWKAKAEGYMMLAGFSVIWGLMAIPGIPGVVPMPWMARIAWLSFTAGFAAIGFVSGLGTMFYCFRRAEELREK